MLQIKEIRCGTFVYGNNKTTRLIIPDNCCPGQKAAPVPVTVEKGTFKSPNSIELANQLATAWLDNNGQRIANAEGLCVNSVSLSDIKIGPIYEQSVDIVLANFSDYCEDVDFSIVSGSEVNAKATIENGMLKVTRIAKDFLGVATVDFEKFCGSGEFGIARVFVDFKYSQNCSTFVKTTCK